MLSNEQKDMVKKLLRKRRDEIIPKEVVSKEIGDRWPVGKEIYYMIDKNVLSMF